MKEWTKDDMTAAVSDRTSAYIYFYTPMCGTCQVAGRMLGIVEELTGITFAKADLNYMPDVAINFEIESVPCLLMMEDGVAVEKVYAFRSVQNLLGILSKYV